MATNEESFGFHPATDNSRDQHSGLRKKFIDFVNDLDSVLPDGREKALVKTNIEQAAMWAHKAIALTDPLASD